MVYPVGLKNNSSTKKPIIFNPVKKSNIFPALPLVSNSAVLAKNSFSAVPDNSLKGKTIMVNPGHGEYRWIENELKAGIFKGAQYPLEGKMIEESNLNDSVAVQVKNGLEAKGATVIYVDNTEVNEIHRLENIYKPDFFVAIHHNSTKDADPKATGEAVLSNDKWSPISAVAAESINKRLKADTTIPQNTTNYKKIEAKLAVLRADKSIPAVLTETGMMCNPDELSVINSPEYQKTTAKCIVDGIADFFKSKNKK